MSRVYLADASTDVRFVLHSRPILGPRGDARCDVVCDNDNRDLLFNITASNSCMTLILPKELVDVPSPEFSLRRTRNAVMGVQFARIRTTGGGWNVESE